MTAPAPFEGLRMFGYSLIYADPAWPFDNYSAAGESRNPNRHYDTMSIDQIKALPVGHLASDNCALFMWVTDPLIPQGLEVLAAWGFRYASVGFNWAKRTRRDTGWHMGTGYGTRANPELCLMGMIGSLERKSAAVRRLIVEPIREHSRKPDRVADDIVALYGNLPRVELFARARRKGWDSWGNETDRFESKEPCDNRREVAGLTNPGEESAEGLRFEGF